jgi:hypothetical protein
MFNSWRKGNTKYDLPAGVVDEVKGICKDYDRKRKALINGVEDEEVRRLYERYNDAVNDALLEIEEGIRHSIFDDIINSRGYERSAASIMIAHNGYAIRKRKLIYNIAINLHFIENRV